VVAVVKDDRHRPTRLIGPKHLLEIHQTSVLLANAESHRFAVGMHIQQRKKSFIS